MDLTPSQIKLLEALAKYRYLTTSHMVQLGIQKQRSNLSYNVLKPLENGNNLLIAHQDFGALPKKGHLPYIYYLTKEGARTLADYLGCSYNDIDFPVKGVQFSADYFHRCFYIDFLIALNGFIDNQSQEYFIDQSYNYFDRDRNLTAGNKNYSPTTLEYEDKKIIPDGLFILDNFKEKKLFAVEIHNDPSTKKILRQLNNHMNAMSCGAMGKRFELKKGNYLLSVYTDVKDLNNVISRIKVLPNFEAFKTAFLFTTIKHIQKDFGTWFYSNGKKSDIFNELK